MNFRNMGGGGHGEAPPPPTPLVRQGSVYSLTFDEFQSTLGGSGKDFGSMNMDELLKNIWTAEESYAMTAALGDGNSDAGAGAGLQRQGSLTLPRTLSQKTVDEVWRDLVGPSSSGQGPAGGGSNVPRQPTLGEMTLEEFLVRAGVVREDMAPAQVTQRPPDNKSNNANVYFGDLPVSSGSSGLALGFNQGPSRINGNIVNAPVPHGSAANLGMNVTAVRPYALPMSLGNSVDLGNPQGMASGGLVGFGNSGLNNGLMTGMVDLGTAGVVKASVSPSNPLSSDGVGKGNSDLSSVSPVPYAFNGGMRGRKSGTLEKVMERRQRRMIKNRESAARSRARKQAYTMELEAEVAKLKEQNQELQKKQADMLEKQKNQILQMINQQNGTKKRCLRRTLTGPW
ncbi:bZIP transcription factor TRAB1 isoform X1 [Canna indica]|uniref:BZIP transcription factor TRAB1 isoform X1 n=1 Tax=Canna indica TaxID=4628 RepID=A0AAQ3Q0D1_9LILI|nr:bZIP transcription factor TRAB1 isoform X1 [Canna indica]